MIAIVMCSLGLLIAIAQVGWQQIALPQCESQPWDAPESDEVVGEEIQRRRFHHMRLPRLSRARPDIESASPAPSKRRQQRTPPKGRRTALPLLSGHFKGIFECARIDLPAVLRARDPKWLQLFVDLVQAMYSGCAFFEDARRENARIVEELFWDLRERLDDTQLEIGDLEIEPDADWLVQLCPDQPECSKLYLQMLTGGQGIPSLQTQLGVRTWYSRRGPSFIPQIHVQLATLPLLTALFGRGVASEIFGARGKEGDHPLSLDASECEEWIDQLLRESDCSLEECQYREILNFQPRPLLRGDLIVQSARNTWAVIRPEQLNQTAKNTLNANEEQNRRTQRTMIAGPPDGRGVEDPFLVGELGQS